MRQKKRELREDEEQSREYDDAEQERNYALIHGGHRCFAYFVHDKNIGGHRGNDNADHDGDREHDAEPDRIETELLDNREKDGGGENHKGEVIDERAADEVYEADNNHDDIPVEGKMCGPVRHELWNVCDRYKMAQDRGASNQQQDHACRGHRVSDRFDIPLEAELFSDNHHEKNHHSADTARFRRGKKPLQEPDDHEHEDGKDD